jgi:hypothetical protein
MRFSGLGSPAPLRVAEDPGESGFSTRLIELREERLFKKEYVYLCAYLDRPANPDPSKLILFTAI